MPDRMPRRQVRPLLQVGEAEHPLPIGGIDGPQETVVPVDVREEGGNPDVADIRMGVGVIPQQVAGAEPVPERRSGVWISFGVHAVDEAGHPGDAVLAQRRGILAMIVRRVCPGTSGPFAGRSSKLSATRVAAAVAAGATPVVRGVPTTFGRRAHPRDNATHSARPVRPISRCRIMPAAYRTGSAQASARQRGDDSEPPQMAAWIVTIDTCSKGGTALRNRGAHRLPTSLDGRALVRGGRRAARRGGAGARAAQGAHGAGRARHRHRGRGGGVGRGPRRGRCAARPGAARSAGR